MLVSDSTKRIIRTSHFWLIIIMTIAIMFLYYCFEYHRQTFDNWFPWLKPVIIFEYRHHINGILLYLPFIYAATIFKWRGAAIIWVVSMILILPHIISFSSNLIFLMSNILYLLMPVMVILFIRWQERERQTIIEREIERQAYMSQVLKAQEDERKRIAHELHDETTQALLVIANNAQSLLTDKTSAISSRVEEIAESIRDSSIQVADDIRRLSIDLRPSILDNLGLLPALSWLVERMEKMDSINAQVLINGVDRKLSPEADVIIFRFVQEALHNVRRHSKATEVYVKLEFNAQTVKISVQDNGNGFASPVSISEFINKGKFGIIGMHERARFLGGRFNISSKPGEGTTVSIEF